MKMQKLWYLIALVALTMLPLAGCGGGGSSIAQTKDGSKITIEGQLDVAALKSTDKSVALSPYSTAKASTVYIIDAQAGTVLTSGAIDASGKFSGLSFTLPSVKSILVFKAVTASGTLRTIVPIDLSNPPASGTITGNQPIVIYINSTSDAIAKSVSSSLGLTGIIGDGGQTLNSKSKTYADAQTLVTNSGGLTLAYGSSGLALSGSVGDNTLLPAWNAGSLTADDLKNIALDGKIISAFISGNQPVVNFQVTNKATGKGISGLRTFSLHVAQLKPELDGAASYWLNYIADGLPITAMPATTSTAITNPSTDAVSSFNTDGSLKGQGYAVVDKGDGTYTVTFGANIKANTKVPYDASLVHRIGITVRSVAVPGVVGKTPGAYAGPINQTTGAVMAQFLNTNGAALVYDFIPATGAAYKDATSGSAFARDIVTIAACNQCHYKIEFGGALGNNTSGHMGSRPDTKICVMCHTNQLAAIATNTIGAGATVGTGNFTNFIHQIHMGEELPVAITATTQALSGAIPASEVRYPQDIRNCTFCHQGADVDHWMSKPTRNACGSCHDNVNFATGVNHGIGGAKADDKACATCHDANGISGYHLPIDVPNPLSALQVYAGAPYNGVFSAYSAAYQANGRVAPGSPNSNTNASYVAAASLSRLPAGAKAISYVINSVSRNASKQPVMEFKFQIATADATGKLGTPVDVIFNKSDGKNEMITGFVGSPSIYWAFAVPQDGITAPVDYNTTVSDYLKRVWDGTVVAKQGAAKAATLTGPVNGYYTITMTGVTIPDSAVMLIGGIGYTYGIGSAMTRPTSSGTTGPYVPFVTTTQPLTQIDLAAYPYKLVPSAGIGTGGLSVPPNNVTKVATGYTGRRVITDNNKCNACHGRLGVKPTFHAGQRNDAPTCTFCHLAGATNSGWPININFDVHAIHGAAKRVNKFSWEVSAGAKYWTVGYPGVLKNCEQCHVAGMYDYSNSAYTANNGSIFDSMLYTTVATGTMPASVPAILTGNETVPGTYYSPFVTAGAVYGTGFSYTSTTGTATPTVQAAPTTLVNSPIASVCFSCHDTKTARSHMVDQGGSIYEARSTALLKKELCIVCHGALSSSNSTNTTTPAVKAVHRWW